MTKILLVMTIVGALSTVGMHAGFFGRAIENVGRATEDVVVGAGRAAEDITVGAARGIDNLVTPVVVEPVTTYGEGYEHYDARQGSLLGNAYENRYAPHPVGTFNEPARRYETGYYDDTHELARVLAQ